MKKGIAANFILLSLVATSGLAAPCPETEFIPLPGIGGEYMRVHPSGNYLIISSRGSKIIDITDHAHPVVTSTLLKDETTPVQAPGGGWTWVASPNNGMEGMKYFNFENIKNQPRNGTASFSDPEFNQFYHSSAELPGSTLTKKKVRTSLYTLRRFKDYEFDVDENGKVTNLQSSPVKTLCSNQQTIATRMSEPTLSTDGTEFAPEMAEFDENGTFRGRVRQIFKLNDDGSCESVDKLGFNTSKIVFDYPKEGKKGLITFTTSDARLNATGQPSNRIFQRVYVHDRDTGKSYPVSDPSESVQYGGFTKDGRIIYQSIRGDQSGVAIAKVSDAIKCVDGDSAQTQQQAPATSGSETSDSTR